MTMIVPNTGQIVAMAQNRSWGTTGVGSTTYNFNVGTKDGGSLGAQAGSTFKAFTLTAALQQGLSPYEYLKSPQTATFEDFKNCEYRGALAPYTVNNSTGSGTFNMLSGAAFSVNTYFMALEEKVTQCAAANAATALGVKRGNGSAVQSNPSFTLGTDEVTPLAMASAYSTFANHGVRCEPVSILAVTDRAGKNLPVPKASCNQVIDRKVADSVTSILSQVIDGPLKGRTGQKMSLGRDAAGKTGTINDSAAVWFVGFTPDMAAAVATYDPRGGYGHPMKNLTIGGHYYAQVFGSSLPVRSGRWRCSRPWRRCPRPSSTCRRSTGSAPTSRRRPRPRSRRRPAHRRRTRAGRRVPARGRAARRTRSRPRPRGRTPSRPRRSRFRSRAVIGQAPRAARTAPATRPPSARPATRGVSTFIT